MKKIFSINAFLSIVFLAFLSSPAYSTVKWIEINGTKYYDGSTFYYSCGESYYIRAYRRDEVNELDIPFLVSSWEFSSHLSTNGNTTIINSTLADNPLLVYTNSGGGGTGYVKAKMTFPFNSTVTINLVNRPPAGTFTTFPNVCNGETKTFRFDPMINNYSGIQWEGLSGVTINGQANYTSSFGERNADITLSNVRGTVRARVIDICGTVGDWNQIELGTASITQALVNGMPATGFNYINNPALLTLQEQRATNCSWVIDNGNGTLYPSNFTCTAYANNFIRVIAQVSNSCGNGDSHTFYLNNGSPYLVYPNPVSDEFTVEFTNEYIAEKLLGNILLINENNEVIKNMNINEIKNRKNKKDLKINTMGVPDGTYYLHVLIGENLIKQKIIINK